MFVKRHYYSLIYGTAPGIDCLELTCIDQNKHLFLQVCNETWNRACPTVQRLAWSGIECLELTCIDLGLNKHLFLHMSLSYGTAPCIDCLEPIET